MNYESGYMVARKAKQLKQKLAALAFTGTMLSTGFGIGYSNGAISIPNFSDNPARHERAIEQHLMETPLAIHPPMIEAREAVPVHAPFRDGTYVQLATIQSARTPEVLDALAKTNLKPFLEQVADNQTRLLVPYNGDERHEIVQKFKSAYPDAKPMLLNKKHGADQFYKYTPRSMATLDDYIIAANGEIEKMPYYDEVHAASTVLAQRTDRNGQNVLAKYKLDQPHFEKLIYSFMYAESSFNPKTVSSVGARGLMQLMPQTEQFLNPHIVEPRLHYLKQLPLFKRLEHPEYNIRAGAEGLLYALQEASQYVPKERIQQPSLEDPYFSALLKKAAAVNNAGAGNVKLGKYLHFKETRDYMNKKIPNNYRLLQSIRG